MKVIKKMLCIGLLTGLLLTQVITVSAAKDVEKIKTNLNENKLYAQSAVLMDAESGRILYCKNSDEQKPMASTTKIMTCILALEKGNPEETVTVSKYAASMPDVQLNIKEGEQYFLKDLLYSLMLESHNDSAVAIAEHIAGGDVADFAAMMNQKAKEIGCTDTWFITPNGLDATETFTTPEGEKIEKIHSTTAADLARIMAYCITASPKKEDFLEITRTASYQFHNVTADEAGGISAGGRSFSCNNHNAFLSMMEGALSGKTGFTGKAGYCYVGALKREDRTFVVALLACGWPNHKSYKWSDTKELMNFGLENFEYREINGIREAEKGIEPIEVKNGQTPYIGGMAYTEVEIRQNDRSEHCRGILLQEGEKIEPLREIPKILEAPVTAGTQIGKISYSVEGEIYWEDILLAAEDVPAIDFYWCLEKIISGYCLK